MLVDRVQIRNYYFSVSTLTSKNMRGTLFVVCFVLNKFPLLSFAV